MDNLNETIQKVFGWIINFMKGLIVLFVLANILFRTDYDPIGGIIDLINSFLEGGFAGFLALLVFVSFLGYKQDNV